MGVTSSSTTRAGSCSRERVERAPVLGTVGGGEGVRGISPRLLSASATKLTCLQLDDRRDLRSGRYRNLKVM